MRPRPLHRRADLIGLVHEAAPTRACRRAIEEDRSLVLGGFNPAEGLPYWLVRVTSRFGREWLVAIHADEERNRFSASYPETVDWKTWAGVVGRNHPVYDGDSPKTFAFKRMEARRCSRQPR